ncbi:MAG TPA: hypothetical protein VLG13_00180 [Patescibacteria group bacterium]|nr:hypothetical protein [Patescibacteria group bacterium]
MASLVIVVGTLVIANYQGSSLQQQLFEARQGVSQTGFNLQTVTDNLARSTFISNLPLFLFWAGLGVIVYLFATSMWGVLAQAEEFREELEYVHAPRHQLVQNTLLHLALRLAALLAWLGYLELFLRLLLPYCLAAAHVAATTQARLSGIGYAFLSFIVLLIALQAHVIFLRLMFLRERMFGSTSIS